MTLPEPKWSKSMRAAEAAYRVGDVSRAQEACRQALRDKPNCPSAYLMLAGIAAEQGNFEAAISAARELLAFGANEDAYHCLGHCYASLGRLEDAAEALGQAVRLNPASPALQQQWGSVLWRLGRLEQATVALKRAVALAPNSPEALVALGHAYVSQGSHRDAVPVLERALKLRPDLAEVYVLLGTAFLDLDQPEESDRMFDRALALGHQSSALFAGLGFRSLGLARFPEAVGYFEKSISMNPLQGPAYGGIAKAKRFTQADLPLIRQMESLVARPDLADPEKLHLHYTLGKAYDDLDRYEAAMSHFVQANRLAKAQDGRKFNEEKLAHQFDATIARFTRDVLVHDRRTAHDLRFPIFIVGMMRSGTTLVNQIVSSHPKVTSGGELPFWGERGHEVFGAIDQAKVDQLANEYLQLLKSIAKPGTRVTDKMPANFMFLGQMYLAFPDSPIIHCRRHPVDTCLSIFATPYRHSPDYAHDPDEIVAFYRQYLRLMDHWRSVLPPDRFLEVDYEDLVANQEPVTRRIIEFCGLDWDDACLSHERNQNTVLTASVWQSRQPMYGTSVGRWRNYEPWLGAFAKLLT